MRKKIKSICKQCGNIEFKEKSYRTTFLKTIFWGFIIPLVVLSSIIGATAFYNFYVGDVRQDPNLVISIGGLHSAIVGFSNYFKSSDYFKPISQGLVKDCPYSTTLNYQDPECQAKKIYDVLIMFRYKDGTDMNPENIWNEKEGDCDEMSNLYVFMLKSIGINAKMVCNHNHCWNTLFLKDKTIHVDIVGQEWREIK